MLLCLLALGQVRPNPNPNPYPYPNPSPNPSPNPNPNLNQVHDPSRAEDLPLTRGAAKHWLAERVESVERRMSVQSPSGHDTDNDDDGWSPNPRANPRNGAGSEGSATARTSSWARRAEPNPNPNPNPNTNTNTNPNPNPNPNTNTNQKEGRRGEQGQGGREGDALADAQEHGARVLGRAAESRRADLRLLRAPPPKLARGLHYDSECEGEVVVVVFVVS